MRSAIIGLGVIGKVHAKALNSSGTEVAAFCDIDIGAAEHARESFSPNAAVYTDWLKMLDEIKPDVVHICTPHYLHAEMVVEALDRGINVLCEKPLCIRREDIGKILAAESRSTAQLGVCHQNRYLEVNSFVKEYLADKKIVGAHCSVAWSRDAEYYNSAPWRGTQDKEGGGVLINQALHTLDLALWFFGEPSEVAATAANLTLKDVIEVEDTLSARFFGANPFSFFATNAAPCGFSVQTNILLESKERLIVMPETLLINGEISLRREEVRSLGKPCYGNGHEALINDFYDCVATGRRFSIDGAEAAKVVRLILAAYESNGEIVKIL